MKLIETVKLTVKDFDKLEDYNISSIGISILILFINSTIIGISLYNQSYYWASAFTVIIIFIVVVITMGFKELKHDRKNLIKLVGEAKISKKIVVTDSDGDPARYTIELKDSNNSILKLKNISVSFDNFNLLSEDDILEIEFMPISKFVLMLSKNGKSVI
jgi:hypothetical protein